jgi:hypothetical protein
MTIEKRIEAFAELGKLLKKCCLANPEELIEFKGTNPEKRLAELIYSSKYYNPWFDEKHILKSYTGISQLLEYPNLRDWCYWYPNIKLDTDKVVGVVMAGNIPAVGFHDFLSILISGFGIKMKLSSADNELLPAMANFLAEIDPWFKAKIEIVEGPIKEVDAIIATGSTNTARYFEYYFNKWPNIIRKNRNAIGILTGTESTEELMGIATDIMSYYGLGCRNISKLLVPDAYNWQALFDQLNAYSQLAMNHKYYNNYEYQKAIMLVNKVQHFDLGFLLLTESKSLASPISVVHYKTYDSVQTVQDYLSEHMDHIQCIVTESDNYENTIKPGSTQMPRLFDYADGIDTMLFLSLLK